MGQNFLSYILNLIPSTKIYELGEGEGGCYLKEDRHKRDGRESPFLIAMETNMPVVKLRPQVFDYLYHLCDLSPLGS